MPADEVTERSAEAVGREAADDDEPASCAEPQASIRKAEAASSD